MKFESQLKKRQYQQLWEEYCGFLNLNIDQYMAMQMRLMEEQIKVWSASGLGKRLLRGKTPQTVEEFRKALPLTSYGDYADILLQKQLAELPQEPVIWIQTTWEGGKHPIKIAPYTRGMVETFKRNVLSVLILATSTQPGQFSARVNDRVLFGLAPLPYVTGLFSLLLEEEITQKFLPPVKKAMQMSFGERNKLGFSMGMQQGIDLFFGMSSVISYISENFSSTVEGKKGGGHNLLLYSPKMVYRYLRAKYRCKRDGVPIKPKDIFTLKGFGCAGTDTRCYKDLLEDYWGVRPHEIAAGTEPTMIATESWTHNGLVLYPDACFYEFIPEEEMLKSLDDPSYQPSTCLLNEVLEGRDYELVVSVLKGGAFARYRVGDVYHCLGIGGEGVGAGVPRFSFVDRIPTVIDIAGFTRITENSIEEVVRYSGLSIQDWVAAKEYKNNRPYLHLYVEMRPDAVETSLVSRQVLIEHLSVYFKHFDSDYHDLKRMLGIDPLEVTVMRSGAISDYRRNTQKALRRMNPSPYELRELLRYNDLDYCWKGRVEHK